MQQAAENKKFFEAGDTLLGQVLHQTFYTFAGPVMEVAPTYELLFNASTISKSYEAYPEGVMPPKTLLDHVKARPGYYAKFFSLLGLPLIFAAGASVGVFYLSLQYNAYLNVLLQSFVELGDPALAQDIVYDQFLQFFMLYAMTYLSSQIVEEITEGVTSACYAEIYRMIDRDEYFATMYQRGENAGKLAAVLKASDVKNIGSFERHLYTTVDKTAVISTKYIVGITQAIMAFSALVQLDPMFTMAIVGFGLGTNIIYCLLTYLRNYLQDEYRKLEHATVDIGYNLVGSGDNMELQGLLQKHGEIAKDLLDKRDRVKTWLNIVDRICSIWSKVADAGRFLVTYIMVALGLKSGTLTQEQRAVITASFEGLMTFLSLRAHTDEMITMAKGLQHYARRVVDTILGHEDLKNLKILETEIIDLVEREEKANDIETMPADSHEVETIKVIPIKSNEPVVFFEMRDLFVHINNRELFRMSGGVRMKSGQTVIIEGANGTGKSTLLRLIKGAFNKFSAFGGTVEILGGTKEEIVYLPSSPTLFEIAHQPEGWVHSANTVAGNIVQKLEDFDCQHMVNLCQRILGATYVDGRSSAQQPFYETSIYAKDGHTCTEDYRKTIEALQKYKDVKKADLEAYTPERQQEFANHIILALLYLMNFPTLATDYGNKAEVDKKSSGQKQAITFARVILQNPKVLMIDEALSNLDVANKPQVLRVLKACLPNLITMIVDHEKNFYQTVEQALGEESVHVLNISDHKIREVQRESTGRPF